MTKTLTLLLCLASALVWAKAPKATKAPKAAADPLKAFSVSLKPKAAAYASLHAGKAYTEADAVAHKADVDFLYLVTRADGSVKRELFNLSGKDAPIPAELVGAKAGIVALSWDDDLLAKCKTVTDLKRMAGGYNAGSFSFFVGLSNNKTGELDNKRFMFLDAQGRMGFFTAKLGADDELTLEGKITP
jgi:hypothetical protein